MDARAGGGDLVANRVWRHWRTSSTRYAERIEISGGTLALPSGLGQIALAELF